MLVAHPGNGASPYSQFTSLVSDSLQHIKADARGRPDYYLSRDSDDFEKDVHASLVSNLGNRSFRIEHISGQKFPDIVAYVNDSKAFGVEVKTAKKNHWKAVGGSIRESTRVANVERIHVFFGRLCNPLGFAARPYEDCVEDVKVTHSPRYFLNLEQPPGQSFFDEMGMSYDDLRKKDNPFDPIKAHLRKTRALNGDDVWWLDSATPNLIVRHWTNLSIEEKNRLIEVGFAFCPELFSSAQDKYKKLSVLLAAKYGVVNSSLRDSYSAGGQFDFNGTLIPKVFQTYIEHKPQIRNAVLAISDSDILHYWRKKNVTDKWAIWKSLALGHALGSRGVAGAESVIRRLLS